MSNSIGLAAEGAVARVAESLAPAINIFDGIMVPYQTPIRRSLTDWATTIRERFFAARQQRRSDLVEGAGPLVNCFNEAALIEVCFGRQDKAAALCSAYLAWVKRHANTPGALVTLQYAFEPFLNLARLLRIAQRYEESLRRIEVVDKVARCQDAWLGDVFIPATLSQEIFARSTPFPRLIRTTYILEWVKALIKCKRYTEAVEFNPPWHNPGDLTARDVIWEGRIIAFCCLGEYEKALDAGGPGLQERDGMNRSVFLFRRAESFAAAGQTEDAVRVAGTLSRTFLNYPKALSITRLGLLVRLTSLMAKLGAEEAAPLAELGLQRATEVGDILFQSEFLHLLADFRTGDATALRLEAAERRRAGLYGIGWNSPNIHGAVETLTEELLRFAEED